MGLNPASMTSLNLTLPASFAASYARHGKRSKLAAAVRKYGDPEITYTEEGKRLAPQWNRVDCCIIEASSVWAAAPSSGCSSPRWRAW